MTEKKCSKCGEIKLLSEFSKHKACKDGIRSRCKSCVRAYDVANKEKIRQQRKEYYQRNREYKLKKQKAYYETNAERISEYYKLWSEANKDHVYEYRQNYYRENKEVIAEKNRVYQKENFEYLAEYKRKWVENNRDKHRASRAKRHSLKKSTATEDPWELHQIVLFYRDCPEGCHVDHIIPLALGGRHELSNLQHLDAIDNASKSAKHPDDWNDPRPISCRA